MPGGCTARIEPDPTRSRRVQTLMPSSVAASRRLSRRGASGLVRFTIRSASATKRLPPQSRERGVSVGAHNQVSVIKAKLIHPQPELPSAQLSTQGEIPTAKFLL